MNTQETELNRILEIIGRIAETTTDGDFIYRGEPQHYKEDPYTDSHIALFFACDGSHDKDGRVILLEKTEEMKDQIEPPQNPQNRIIAQKSIFVRPPKGFLGPGQYNVIGIPKALKGQILDYLQKQHGISTQSVYNDLHGFIRNQHTHQETYMEAYKGGTQPREDVLQIDSSQPDKKKET